MILGYARVSTDDQNLDRQLDQLQKAGCEKIYQEKITGTKKERPELIKMLENVRAKDSIIIVELSRLGRSTRDLIDLAEQILKKGVELVSLKENIDTKTATGRAMFGMLSVMAQFERDIISERTKQGLESARSRGRKGGHPSKSSKDVARAIALYDSKQYSVKEIEGMTGISKPTLYRYLRERKDKTA